jgi:hypothetical protein
MVSSVTRERDRRASSFTLKDVVWASARSLLLPDQAVRAVDLVGLYPSLLLYPWLLLLYPWLRERPMAVWLLEE